VGGTALEIAVAGIGFLAGAAYGRAERSLGISGIVGALVLTVAAAAAAHHLKRRANRKHEDERKHSERIPKEPAAPYQGDLGESRQRLVSQESGAVNKTPAAPVPMCHSAATSTTRPSRPEGGEAVPSARYQAD